MLVPLILILSNGLAVWAGLYAGLIWIPVVFFLSFAGLSLLATAVVWALTLPIDRDTPRQEDSPFYRKLAMVSIQALIQLLQVRIYMKGTEKLPREGRFLLVCNHNFAADPGILLHALPDCQLAFISKKENRDLFIVGRIMHAMLCQTIDRENDRAALKTILECIRLIKEDKASIAVFPEGATNSDNDLHPFRPGVFRIAQKTKVPIVVCTLRGTRDILKNGLRLKPTDVHLHLLRVIGPEEYEGMKTTEISDLVWSIMSDDLGPESVLPGNE
ncbi:MAG: 1-acyl-sn-glycerol-3-phosphate acyltransferase [Oscillospiraceae bacterium]|nr:1-acyl-sn-glycerol-3-phosphate acyltransferase [Oscillospiraceae bacterium]